MQVANLYSETAKVLDCAGSMDLGMENHHGKYMKGDNVGAPDDGYETYPMDDIGHNGGGNRIKGMEHFKDDIYSFVDEMPNVDYSNMAPVMNNNGVPTPPNAPKKRGRKRKQDVENGDDKNKNGMGEVKERKRDRFNGMSEQELSQKTLPDYLVPGLDVVIVGINPGLFAAFKGRHYAGPGNHLWKCLHLSGLINEPLSSDDDYRALQLGIGFTNLVPRPTKGSSDLTRREIREGCHQLLAKLQKYRPRIAVFNGKLVYEIFSGKKDFPFGRQKDFVDGTNTIIWVMPSASARCAQLPRCGDKIPFYLALKKFSDCVKEGGLSELNENDFVFFESNKQGSSGDPMKRKRLEEGEECVGVEIPVKKKRGRPRKGMEKATLEAKENNKGISPQKKAKDVKGPTNKNPTELTEGGQQRRKRGRPKKYKPEDQVVTPSQPQQSTQPPGGGMFDVSGASTFDKKTANAIASTLNAVSSGSSSVSGYSSGTSGSGSSTSEERRENGSMSNAGSSGPSPSHHSFTTQSDLSSEISAAMDLHSCGSTPSSPLNNNSNNNNTNTNGSNNSSANNNSMSSNIISSSNNGSNSNEQQSLFDPTGGDERSLLLNSKHMLPNNSHPHQSMYPSPIMDSQQTADVASSYPSNMYPPSYPNQGSRLPPILQDHRSNNSYHSNIPENGPGPSQQNAPQQTSTFNPFESKPQSVVDMAAKSLSGLESLVDQIPSIAEQSEPIGGADGMNHSHSMPPHGGNHYEASSGFLPYGHHHPSHHGSSSYAPAPYYGDFNSSGYPLSSTPYGSGSPATPTPLPFSYANYPGHYAGGYNHGSTPALHIPPSSYGSGAPGYSPSPYHHPHNPYSYTMSQTSPPNGQRFPQRLHQSMDLSHLGF